jgi:hypothetical protein
LANTHTISAGTFVLYYWPELTGTPQVLAAAIGAPDTVLDLTTPGTALAGSFIQLEAEIAQVTAVQNNGTRYQLTRGLQTTSAAAHASGTMVYTLQKKTQVVPFVRDFFGSPASGDWSFATPLPDCRVVSAELFVTNVKGNSPTTKISMTQGVDFGLRTLSGGQLSFQVEAFLAIETGATPDLIVENAHSVRDVFAMIRQAPVGGPVELQVNQNGTLYCSLTIADGATISNSAAGTSLPALISGARLSLDITMVGPSNPGADLTIIIRL